MIYQFVVSILFDQIIIVKIMLRFRFYLLKCFLKHEDN